MFNTIKICHCCSVLCCYAKYLSSSKSNAPKSFAKLTSLYKLILCGNLITDCETLQSLGLSKDLKLCMRWNTTSTNWKIMSLFNWIRTRPETSPK